MKKAVVLLSGGLDSTTTLAIAKSEGCEVYALSFKYGQRHEIELELAAKNAALFEVKKHLTVEFNMRDIGGSALTDDIEVPKDSNALSVTSNGLKDDKCVTNIPVTYVPARNTIFLSFALAWAESLKADNIYIGANAVDYSGYPDCRPAYISAFENMANLATKISVEGNMKFKIHTPLIKLTKAEIIKKGMELDVDYSQTWSCYDPVNDKEHGGYVPCLKCDSCRFRAKGFDDAGVKDPLL
jgi:7-cyano-7-deazaguanine synthase